MSATARLVVEHDLHAAAIRRVHRTGLGLVLVPTLFEAEMAPGPIYVAEAWRCVGILGNGTGPTGARI